MFERDANNPLITARHLPWSANAVFNPGATVLPDGDVALLLRVEDRRGLSSIHVARSADGSTGWRIDREPLLCPNPDDHSSQWGFEDARVSYIEELGTYVITCTAYGAPGPCVFLATSDDLTSIQDSSIILPPEDKNAALFPRRINGQWVLVHRPVVMAIGAADVWVSVSDDLWGWRQPQQVLLRRPAGWWDGARVGIGPPPIETAEGWLQLYHGVRVTMSGSIYRVSAALLDLDEPWRVTHRLDDWLLSPVEPYERIGDVPNVVFPTGAIVCDDGRRLDVYYGAADTSVCRASVQMDQLLDLLRQHPGDGMPR